MNVKSLEELHRLGCRLVASTNSAIYYGLEGEHKLKAEAVKRVEKVVNEIKEASK